MLINTKWNNRILALEKLCKIWYNINIEDILFYNKFIRRNKMKTSSTKETVCRIGDAGAFIGLLAVIGALIFGLMTCLWADMTRLSFAISCGIGVCIAYMLYKYFPELAKLKSIRKIRKVLERKFYRFLIVSISGCLVCNICNSLLVLAYPQNYILLHMLNVIANGVIFFFFIVYDLEEE